MGFHHHRRQKSQPVFGWIVAGALTGIVGGTVLKTLHVMNGTVVPAENTAAAPGPIVGDAPLLDVAPEIFRIAKKMEKEMELVGKAANAKPEEQPAIAAAFAAFGAFMPVSGQWFIVNHDLIGEPGPWTDAGFDPSVTPVPKEMLYICACNFGMADIDNGGLHQFFTNDTGVFAPEMVEGFRELGLTECASIMERAIGVFKGKYSRSQEARQAVVDALSKEAGDWEKVFSALDGELGKSREYQNFGKKADRYIAEKFGIKSAKDRPWSKK